MFSEAVEVSTHQGNAQFPNIRTTVEADLRGWLPVMGVILSENQIEDILRQADQALAAYTARDGRLSFDLSAHLVMSTKG